MVGYHLFDAIATNTKTLQTNPGATGVEKQIERTTALVRIFSSKAQEFIEVLDCVFHKKPTTTDWVAIATSVALIFDMFQYEFHLLHVSSSLRLRTLESSLTILLAIEGAFRVQHQ
jgi:hypothetical protein